MDGAVGTARTAVRAAAGVGDVRYSGAALRQLAQSGIWPAEVGEALGSGDVIELYDGPGGQSCLVLGWTDTLRQLHVHCSWPTVTVLNVYEPRSEQWTDGRIRVRG
ncbi:MAG: DUF4258 domain-containing protein [Chloroflexi bacterium]|nr:DUF4258 domain-containing protein [Chloroflexota bacterium]